VRWLRWPAMAASIDVVIVAHNRYELTESCLRHLAAQSVAHQVILVDNGSSDDSAARVAEHWPAVQLVAFEDGRGFAEACNRGVSAGTGAVVVLLNNDVDCEPDFLEQLTAPLDADPQLGSVAALLLQPGGQTIDSVGLVADVALACFPRLQGRGVGEAQAQRPALTGPAGAGAAYRRAAWEEVGGMDEAIFAYMEDFDLALRLRSAGWGTVAATDARGIHLGSASHGHRSASQRRHGGFGRGYVLRRYGVLRSRAGARALTTEVVVVLGDLVISRDVAAIRGRLEGWRAARHPTRLPAPPPQAIDARITFRDSLALRRGVYGSRAA
jgi:N-acetylglucosaminyl-diphospho-decaprenol L-rhamnosyltransferase